jgi:hypothetical protein
MLIELTVNDPVTIIFPSWKKKKEEKKKKRD